MLNDAAMDSASDISSSPILPARAANHLRQRVIDPYSSLRYGRGVGFSGRLRLFCDLLVNNIQCVSRAHRLWVMLFVGLQICDILTTNRALAMPGVWEANPLMAWSQAELGAVWWLPKLAVVAYLSLSASFMRRRWPMIFAASISGLCVVGNLANF
jgi:hypothetical protein